MKFLDIAPGHQETLEQTGCLPEQVHVFDKEHIQAVNAALAARRPLLIRGEPGIGKSQLARAAAKMLGRAYVTYTIDSNSEPQDLLYHFDAVQRLAEAQLIGACGGNLETARKKLAISRYITPGPLWWAFDWEKAKEPVEGNTIPEPPQVDGGNYSKGIVVLIDEIDKAESDLPNGLLEALGGGRFQPRGMTEPVVVTGTPPLIVITSNEERALPNAFVRRCLVLQLQLPIDLTELKTKLIQRGYAHFSEIITPLSDTVLQEAADIVADDRAKAEDEHLYPLPGQAEYLDLLRAVFELVPAEPAKQVEKLQEIKKYVTRKQKEWSV